MSSRGREVVVVGFRRKKGQQNAYPITRSLAEMRRKRIIQNGQQFKGVSPQAARIQKRKEISLELVTKRINELENEGKMLVEQLDSADIDDERAEEIRNLLIDKTPQMKRLVAQQRILQKSIENGQA